MSSLTSTPVLLWLLQVEPDSLWGAEPRQSARDLGALPLQMPQQVSLTTHRGQAFLLHVGPGDAGAPQRGDSTRHAPQFAGEIRASSHNFVHIFLAIATVSLCEWEGLAEDFAFCVSCKLGFHSILASGCPPGGSQPLAQCLQGPRPSDRSQTIRL